MSIYEKWNYIVSLDEELLKGGIVINEYIAELIRNADLSFVYDAYLSSIITSVAAIEGYFKSEENSLSETFCELINKSNLDTKEINMLHKLRKYRNKIVHVNSTLDDEQILDSYDDFIHEPKLIAMEALRLLRIVAYSNPFV